MLVLGMYHRAAMARRVELRWEGKDRARRRYEDSGTFPARCEEVDPGALASNAAAGSGTRTADTAALQLAGGLAGRIVHADALDLARVLAQGYTGRADLIYVDPPYGSGLDYTHEERLDGRASGAVVRAHAYSDRWADGQASWLDMMYPMLLALAPLLGPSGSLWVHIDWRATHLVRALCDEIFGPNRFLNEIVWRRAPNLGRQARSGQFGRTFDTIVVYGGDTARLVPPARLVPVEGTARLDPESGRFFTTAPRGDYTDASVAKLEAEGRIHRSPSGQTYVKYWLECDARGRLCKRQPADALWTDVPPLRHASPSERTGYPTQKPVALLERIVACATPPGGLVIDPCAGSGTTGCAAASLGRRFVLGDASAVAIATMRARLLREGRALGAGDAWRFSVERCGATRAPATRVEVRARACEGGVVRVSFRPPRGAEPVAWAVDVAPRDGGPFVRSWHAERGTGRRPAPLPTEASVAVPRRRADGAGAARSARVRVWFVDGSVAEGATPVKAASESVRVPILAAEEAP